MPHPNGPRLLCSFILFPSTNWLLCPHLRPPGTHHICQASYTRPFESSTAGCSRRLSDQPARHSILCDPNAGTLTRKPKPRADKQAPGHTGPQPEARKAGHRESAVPAASAPPALKTEASASPKRSPEGKDLEETDHWTRPQAHQTLTSFCCPGGACGGQEVTQVQSPGGYWWPHLQGSHPQPS